MDESGSMPPEVPQAPPRAPGVLIVDDEAGIRGVLNAWMRQQGFAVWLAADGRQAIELYRHHHESIDVVLLDVRMPGLDGPQTLAALQALRPEVRCCFMSGDLGTYTAEALENLGGGAVLRKPFHLAEAARVLCELASKDSRTRPANRAPVPCPLGAEPRRVLESDATA